MLGVLFVLSWGSCPTCQRTGTPQTLTSSLDPKTIRSLRMNSVTVLTPTFASPTGTQALGTSILTVSAALFTRTLG